MRLSKLLVVTSLLLLGFEAFGQSQTTGTLEGLVVDSNGDGLPGVTVVLTNTGTNFSKTLVTNELGRYRGLLMPLGIYRVRAGMTGFTEAEREGIRVSLGRPAVVNLTLTPDSVSETLTVAIERPVVETTRTELSTQIDDRSIQSIPNNGRNFLDFVNLTPGVGIVQGPDGEEISINGQKGIQNNISVDGADFNNPFFGEQRGGQRPPFTFNLDAVEEVVVIAEGAPAEFGRSSGGFVNVVTKSGTNNYQGTAHVFWKDDSFSAEPGERVVIPPPPDLPEDLPEVTDEQQQIGFTAGGPLIKDKLFYFVTADSQRRRTFKQVNPGRIDSRLVDYFDSIGSPDENGPIERTDDALVALAKLDWQINPEHLLTMRLSYMDTEQENGTFDVDSWGRSANATEQSESYSFSGTLLSTIGSGLLNELRFQYARENRPRPYGGPIASTGRPLPDTAMDFVGGYRFGMPFFIPVDYHDVRVQLNNNISWFSGNHSFKAGIEVNHTRTAQTFVGFANGRFIFNSVEGFLNYAANPNYVECSDGSTSQTGICPDGASPVGPVLLYLQLAGVGGLTPEQAGTQAYNTVEPAIFFQDKWEPRSNLSIQYGLRYEAELRPDTITPADEVFYSDFIGQVSNNQEFPSDGEIPDTTDMWQPRLGISWDPGDDGRSVLRMTAGIYYARLAGLVMAQPRTANGSIGQQLFRASFTGGVPAYGELIPQEEVGEPFFPGVAVFDKDFKNPRTFQTSISYERQLGEDYSILFKYVYARTKNQTRFVDRNDALLGSPWSSGLDPDGSNGIGALTVVESSASSLYRGYNFTISKRWSNNYQFQVNYTYSEDMSDDDNERDPFTFRYARVTDLDAEWGYSDRHQPHRVNAWASWEAPYGIMVNGSYSYRSAQPLSLTETGAVAATPQDRINADGSIFPRNTGKKDNKFSSFDMRLSRPFKTRGGYTFEPIVEVFNLFNSENFLTPAVTNLIFNFDGTVQSGAGNPRQYQAGLKMKW